MKKNFKIILFMHLQMTNGINFLNLYISYSIEVI